MSRTRKIIDVLVLVLPAVLLLHWGPAAQACSRILYETGTGTYIVGRGMDWNDATAKTSLWVFPEGMKRDGGTRPNPIEWTSKYGSVVAFFSTMPQRSTA